jgi:hypothetical protein
MTRTPPATGELKHAVERTHGGSAEFVQSVPVRETFEGETVREGVVHVFDLTGHPTATRAYAWSSPSRARNGGSLLCCMPSGSTRRWKRCAQRS